MDENIKWHNSITLNEVAKNLVKNNFQVYVAKDLDDAKNKILETIKLKEEVGAGGSISLEELGILNDLRKRGQKVLQHTQGMPLAESLDIRRKALVSDVYMASPNAVTRDGALLFCDGAGNRAAAVIFGPKKVIAIAGINKIVSSEEAGWCRIDDIAAPQNAKRLNLSNPCTLLGRCGDCDSATRICNVGVTIWKKPKQTEYLVVLVPEYLGY